MMFRFLPFALALSCTPVLATPAFNDASGYRISPADQPDQCMVFLDWTKVPPEQYPVRIQPCASVGDGAALNITAGAQGRVKISSMLYPGRDVDYVQPDGYPNVAILGPSDPRYHNQDYVIKQISSDRYQIINAWLDNTGLCTKQVADALAVTLDSCSMDWRIVAVSDSAAQVAQGASTSSHLAPAPLPPSAASSTSPVLETVAVAALPTTTPATVIPTTPPASRSTSLPVDGNSGATTFRTSIILTELVAGQSTPSIPPQPTQPTTPTPTQISSASRPKTTSGGEIGGGVGGVGFAIVVLSIAGFCCHRKRQRRKQPNRQRQYRDYDDVPDMDKTRLYLTY